MVLQMPEFSTVNLTKIGSPFVIDTMEAALAQNPNAKVAGYEANGGFLLGFTAEIERGSTLTPLMTRDSLLPLIVPLVAAKKAGKAIEDLVKSLPAVFTAADRLQAIPPEASKPFLERLKTDPSARADFLDVTDTEVSINTTDGLRITLQNGAIIHLRPSGNAPEFRCYAEAQSPKKASDLVARYLEKLKQKLT
jgi:phosphomannomutase